MWVFQRVVVSFILTFSGFWAFFPGGFGMLHFREAHPGLIGQVGRLCWWLLLLVHPLALYRVWGGDNGWLWLGSIAAMQVLFFLSFCRDTSTGGNKTFPARRVRERHARRHVACTMTMLQWLSYPAFQENRDEPRLQGRRPCALEFRSRSRQRQDHQGAHE